MNDEQRKLLKELKDEIQLLEKMIEVDQDPLRCLRRIELVIDDMRAVIRAAERSRATA